MKTAVFGDILLDIVLTNIIINVFGLTKRVFPTRKSRTPAEIKTGEDISIGNIDS